MRIKETRRNGKEMRRKNLLDVYRDTDQHSRTFSGVLETRFIRVSLPRRWAASPLEMRMKDRISKGDVAHLLGRETRMNCVSSTPENVRECARMFTRIGVNIEEMFMCIWASSLSAALWIQETRRTEMRIHRISIT